MKKAFLVAVLIVVCSFLAYLLGKDIVDLLDLKYDTAKVTNVRSAVYLTERWQVENPAIDILLKRVAGVSHWEVEGKSYESTPRYALCETVTEPSGGQQCSQTFYQLTLVTVDGHKYEYMSRVPREIGAMLNIKISQGSVTEAQ